MSRPFIPKTLGDRLYWSYANLAMYQMALTMGLEDYTKVCYIKRSKLLRRLRTGETVPSSIYREERRKLSGVAQCVYCGCEESLTLDHLFPKARGGSDSGDNLVYVCRSCNSSKGKLDLFEWIEKTGRPFPEAVATRYLKNAISYSKEHELMDLPLEEAEQLDLPFSVIHLPSKIPLTRDAGDEKSAS